ncbi:MAG: DUF4270 domain-containing protein [Flavobacteriaceae bacterium]|jgi:hypothetical protein|nr:DUF4270 domain-containing protein [Flavobacteriaceae bacterium]
MNQKRIIKGLFLALGILGLQSCDKDFTNVGSDIIDNGNLKIEAYTVQDIVSYNQAYGAMDTRNLLETPLGSINSDAFGNTSSSIVTQLQYNAGGFQNIGDNPVIDSVYVYVPYFSKFDKVENEIQYYKLDNMYGSESFNLEVYQNEYLLRDVEIGSGDEKKYFSDMSSTFDSNKKGVLLNDKSSDQNSNFRFKNTSIQILQRDKDGNLVIDKETGKSKVKETLSPGMWLDLNKQYFQDLFMNNKDKLTDTSEFQNYFRGLYFKATPNSTSGAIGLLNFKEGRFVIKYTYDEKSKDADGKEIINKKQRSINLTFISTSGASNPLLNTNIAVNLFNQTKTPAYQQALAKANKINGDELLYVKGTEGSVAVLDLFNKNNGKELSDLRDKNLLINDAILTVYVDQNIMKEETNAPRLHLYNYDTGQFIADFTLDKVSNQGVQKPYYGGIFEKKDEANNKPGFIYRIRITSHISNILKNTEAKNPKLAIAVSNEYSSSTMDYMFPKSLKNIISNTPRNVEEINPFSITCPVGTVLYGTKSNNIDKKLRLEIFYTKTN